MPSPPSGDEQAGAIPGPGSKKYTLLGADRRPYPSETPGQFGGHRKMKIYGRLDCPSALRAIAVGGYVASRVPPIANLDARRSGHTDDSIWCVVRN